jgi:hypothetical protein
MELRTKGLQELMAAITAIAATNLIISFIVRFD